MGRFFEFDDNPPVRVLFGDDRKWENSDLGPCGACSEMDGLSHPATRGDLAKSSRRRSGPRKARRKG